MYIHCLPMTAVVCCPMEKVVTRIPPSFASPLKYRSFGHLMHRGRSWDERTWYYEMLK